MFEHLVIRAAENWSSFERRWFIWNEARHHRIGLGFLPEEKHDESYAIIPTRGVGLSVANVPTREPRVTFHIDPAEPPRSSLPPYRWRRKWPEAKEIFLPVRPLPVSELLERS